jgi:hypothetical protein
MTAPGAEPAEILRLALEAISDRDAERLAPLLVPEVTIRTGRSLHEGQDAAGAWARKGYDHLDKRYALALPGPTARSGSTYLWDARVEYVWRESGEVGDSTRIWLVVEFDGALIRRLELHDSEQEARAEIA